MQFPKQILNDLKIGASMSFEGLSIFPIIGSGRGSPDAYDLEEAMDEGWVEVSEVSEAGHVPELEVINRSDPYIIICDGQELLGAKQNRIVNVTVVVGPHSRVIIPVSCVEQGRWSRQSHHFAAGEFAYPSLRRDKFQRVTENLRTARSHQADQGMIWNEIAAKSARMGVQSDTGAMKDLADRYFRSDEDLKKGIPLLENQIGYLGFIRGGFAGGDLFGSTELCSRKFHKLIRSYYLDSRDPGAKFPEMIADDVLKKLKASQVEPVDSVGAGEELRYQTDGLQGAATFLTGDLVHLTIFPKVDSGSSGPKRRYGVD